MKQSKVLNHLDIVVAIVGIVLVVFIIPVLIIRDFHPIYSIAVGIGGLCILVYLLYGRNLSWELSRNHKTSWPWIVLAVVAFISAVLVFATRSNSYEKPLAYYILVAISVVFAFLGAITSKDKKQAILLLVLACAIGLTHIWTEHLMFPNSLIGIDPWTHMSMTMKGLDLAGIDGNPPLILTMIGGSYSLMHIYLRWVIDITGLDYKWASLIFMGSLQMVGNIVLAYLIGRELFNSKVGLVASLMVANANWNIFFGEWIIPNGIGATLCLLVGYLFIKSYKSKKHWIFLFSFLCLPIAYLTHAIVSVWVVGTIVCLSVVILLFDLMESKKVNLYYALGYPVLAVISFFAWYKFAVLNIISNIEVVQFNPSFGSTSSVVSTLPTVLPPVVSSTPIPTMTSIVPSSLPTLTPSSLLVVQNYLNNGLLGEILIDSIGMLLYFGIALIGILIMLKYMNLHKAWAILCIGTLALGFFPPLLGFTLIEHRWWYLAEVFMSLPLSVALVSLANKRLWVIVGLVGIIVFTSIIGLPSNMTNRTFSPNLIVRYAFTEGELEGLKVAESYNPKIIGSDPIYLGYVREIEREKQVEYLDNYILEGDFTECPADVILLRDALYKEPFGFGSGKIYRLEFNPIELAVKQGYKDAWSNSKIHVLVRQ